MTYVEEVEAAEKTAEAMRNKYRKAVRFIARKEQKRTGVMALTKGNNEASLMTEDQIDEMLSL